MLQGSPGRYRPLSAHLLPLRRAQSRQSAYDDDPAAHPWSSYRHNALGQPTPLITPHEQYTLLASTPAARQAIYRALVHERVEERSLDEIRQHTQQQRAWGSERFQQQIEALTLRSVSVKPRGRPPKSPRNQD